MMSDVTVQIIISGLAVGFLFGFGLQRGRFCMNSSFRNVILMKDFDLLNAVGLAILVQMIGFHLMAELKVISLNPLGFAWGNNIIGGFAFGVGMVLAGGYSSGTAYRVGEGMVGSMVALAGFGLGGISFVLGPLSDANWWLYGNTKILVNGKIPTLPLLLGTNPWVLILFFSIVSATLWILRKPRIRWRGETFFARFFKNGWPWVLTGFFIGFIGILSFPLSAAVGRNYPLSITDGWVYEIIPTPLSGEWHIGFAGYLFAGLILGSFIAAKISHELKLRSPPKRRLIQFFVGGLLLGAGAVVGGGCNIGHILSGVPQLAVSSIVAGTFIILGN